MSCVLHGAQAGLRRREVSRGTRRPPVPLGCHCWVLRHALAVLVHQAHVVVRLDVAAPGRRTPGRDAHPPSLAKEDDSSIAPFLLLYILTERS